MEKKNSFRSGIVAVVGRPNVGKSSLMNSFLEYRLSIISAKPQTTRDNILGLYNNENCQIVFIDTPGIHKPVNMLGTRLVDRALSTFEGADLILFVVTIDDRPEQEENQHILEAITKSGKPVLLAINKVDLPASREKILPLIQSFSTKIPLIDVIPVSAKDHTNRETLLHVIAEHLPVQSPLYPDDILTDRPERFIAQEIIREKVIAVTDQEVPHSVAVEVEEYKSPEEYPERKDLFIRATIFVERDGQKAIVLGKKGEKIKAIGTAARKALEEFSGHKTYLDLWVKVDKGWRDSEQELEKLGYGEE